MTQSLVRPKLTQANVKKQLQAIGMTFRKNAWGEFRVAFGARFGVDHTGRNEASAYYTDDLEDALHTGEVMARDGRGFSNIQA